MQEGEGRVQGGGHALLRWFVLEVVTEGGEQGTQVRTGKLNYYHTMAVASQSPQEGVEIPLHECMGVSPGLGKTKGTEHRITLKTPSKARELGERHRRYLRDRLGSWVSGTGVTCVTG